MVPVFPRLAQDGKAEEIIQMADRMPVQMNDLTEVQRSMGVLRGRNKDPLTSSQLVKMAF